MIDMTKVPAWNEEQSKWLTPDNQQWRPIPTSPTTNTFVPYVTETLPDKPWGYDEQGNYIDTATGNIINPPTQGGNQPMTTPTTTPTTTQPATPTYGWGGSTGGGQMPYEFPYPPQWGTSSDVLTHFAQGAPTQYPSIWQQGGQLATQMAQTGMPTSYAPAYEAAKQVVDQNVLDAIKQAAEQAGLAGTRWSSTLGSTAQDIAGRYQSQLGTQYTAQEMGAQEAAAGRQLGALSPMYQFGAGGVGLAESAKDRGMQAAGMLPQLGQMYADLPMDWSQRMMGMGGLMQGTEQEAYNRQYQDWLRTVPETSPWLSQAMGYFGTPSQMAPQQYQPSTMSNLLGMIPGLGLGIGLCRGG